MREFIDRKKISAEDILNIISIVGQNKDIIIVKNDGIRDDHQYSVIIISSKHPEKNFRCDSGSLDEAIKEVLKEYVANCY